MTARIPATARIVKLWLDVAFVLGAIACAGFALFLAFSPLTMRGGETPADVAIPVAIGERSILPVMPLEVDAETSGTVASPRVVKGRGELRFETTSWGLHFLSALGVLLAAAVGTYLVYLLRRVLKTVIDGEPFAAQNARLLRRVGSIVLAAGIVLPLVEYMASKMVLSRVRVADMALSPPFDVHWGVILGGLVILVLAAIFAYGGELERDRALTV